MNPVDAPYEFNKVMLRLNRVKTHTEEKERLLRIVASSPQATVLYLYFLEYGCEGVDPRSAGLAMGTLNRLLARFSGLGLIEKSGRRRGGKGLLVTLWRLRC